MMEEPFPASILLVAGLLRVAGASRSELWSSHTTDQSSLEEGLVTVTGHLVPIREDDATQVTLPFESFTPDFPNDAVSNPHEIFRTEAEENSKDRGQPLTFPASQPRRSEGSFSEGAVLDHQSRDSSTNRPLISRSTFGGLSKMVAESANQPEALTTFLRREDRMGNATGHDFSVSGKPSSLVPTEAAETDVLRPLQPEPSESAGQKMTTDSSPSVATRPGNPPTFTLGTDTTKPGVVLGETKWTPAKERLGNLLTFLPRDSRQPMVNGGRMQPDLRTSETPRAPGLSVEAQLSLSALSRQRPLPEEHVATQQPDFASSPHGKTTRHEAVILRTAETPAVLISSQSHTPSFSLLLIPETLSSGSPLRSAVPGDAGQRDQATSFFPSPFPSSSNPGVPGGAEVRLQESTPLTLQPETHPQMATRPSHFQLSQITAALRDPLPVSKGPGTTPEVPVPTQEQPELPTALATVDGKARGRALSLSPLGKTTSLHARPTMPCVAAPSHVQLPLPDTPDAAGGVTQGTSTIPLPSTFPPLVHRPQASLPPLAEAELLATSSASVPTKPPTPGGIPATADAGPTRLGTPASLLTAPQHDSEDLSVEAAASIPSELPTPAYSLKVLASASAGPHSSAATDAAHSAPGPLGLSTIVHSEPQGRALGMLSQVEHQTLGSSVFTLRTVSTLGSSVSTLNTPTVPETPVPSPVETGAAAAAGLSAPSTAAHGRTEPKLSPDLSSPFDATTPSLPIGAHARLQPAAPSVRAPGPQVPVLGVTLPAHFQSPTPGDPASVTKEAPLFATPVRARAKLNTKEAQAEGSLPVSTEASASIPTRARAPLVLPVYAQTQHHLSHVSARFGAKTKARGAQTPSPPASSPGQRLGQLRPQPASSSAFVQTELQPQAGLTSAEAAALNPKGATPVHPDPHLPTAPVLPGMHHIAAKEEEGKSSLPSSLPASQTGTYSAPSPGVSAAAPAQKAEGRDQSPGAPPLSRPASQTVRHKSVDLPILSSMHMTEPFPGGVRTTPILAREEAQDLTQSSPGFLLHLLNQSEVTVDGNLDSAVASSYLGIPSSLQHLSFSIRGAENMICLQPVQNTPPPSGGPNASGPGVASFQELLISSTFLGLSHPGASSLIQMSPSGVLLVKPMFVFLPADAREDPVLHSTEEEEEEHTDRHLFPNAAVLRMVASSYERLAENNSATRQSTRAGGPSSKRQAASGSVLSPAPEYATGSSRVRSTALKAELFPDQLREVATTRTKSSESRDQEEGLLSSVLDPPKSGENNTTPLSVEHHVSAAPPTMASVYQRRKTPPSSGELLSSPFRVTSLPSAMEHSASPMPERASRSECKSQLSTKLMLHAEEGHPPGSVTPITSSTKNSEEPLRTSSARNMDLPLEEVKNLTSLRAVSHRFLITKAFRKPPSEVQHMPSTVSGFLTFSVVKDLKESAAANYSNSEAVPAFPRATEASSYVMNGTLAKVSKSPLFSLIPSRASERPRPPTLPTPFLAYTQAHTPLSGKHLEDMNLQGRSRPPVSVSSPVSTNSYFATSATKDHRANLMLVGRASLTRTEGQTGATVNNETGKNVRDAEIHNPREATHFTPTTAPTLLFTTGFSSASVASGGPVGSVGFRTEIRKSPLTALHSLAPSSTHKDTTASPISGRSPPSKASHTERHSLRLSVTAATDKAAFSSPLTAEKELLQHSRGQKAEVSPPFPASSSLAGDHQQRARPLKYEQTQDSGSSVPSPNSTSSSLGTSGVTKAPAFLMTILPSGVPSNGPLDKVLNQTSHLRSLPLDTSEATLSLHTQVLRSLASLSDTSEMTAKGDFMVEATSAGDFDESYLHTAGEQATVVMGAAEAAVKDSQAGLQQSDSNSSLLDWKMSHRRPTRSEDVFLDGFAVVSDEACGSGNYTSEMSLRRATGRPPSPPDSFLARIVLQSNGSHPTLRVESCCVTPTARPTGPDAACCLFFPRTPLECRYIELHQNGKPQTASFTIQLFRMLNRSVAYLHCELSICLSNLSGCQQSCSENREARFKPRGRSSYHTLHNLISFGPVLKAQPEFPSELAAESELAMMFPVLLGSLAGIAILLGISIFIWFHQRNQVKMAADQEEDGLCTP